MAKVINKILPFRLVQPCRHLVAQQKALQTVDGVSDARLGEHRRCQGEDGHTDGVHAVREGEQGAHQTQKTQHGELDSIICALSCLQLIGKRPYKFTNSLGAHIWQILKDRKIPKNKANLGEGAHNL